MDKIITALIAALFIAGCSSEQNGSGTPTPTHPAVPDTPGTGTVIEGTPGWLDLHRLSLHRDMEAVSPMGLYVKGSIDDNDRFTPTSGIEGTAVAEAPDSGTTRGWVELTNQQFHAMQEAVAPREPYVEGVMAEDGTYFPDEPYRIIGAQLQ